MYTVIKGGILIGLLCAMWTFVMGFTGWYKDPVMLNAFYVVILIEIGVLIWGLKITAAGKTYGGQVAAGTLMAVIGGLILIGASLLFTTVVFPGYFDELRTVHAEMLRNAGTSEAEIAAELERGAQMQTTMMQAVVGFVGTVLTGVVGSLIMAVFIRKKQRVTTPATL